MQRHSQHQATCTSSTPLLRNQNQNTFYQTYCKILPQLLQNSATTTATTSANLCPRLQMKNQTTFKLTFPYNCQNTASLLLSLTPVKTQYLSNHSGKPATMISKNTLEHPFRLFFAFFQPSLTSNPCSAQSDSKTSDNHCSAEFSTIL